MPIDPLLVAKLTLTPALIGAISLAARRFGPTVGGALSGLPWTSSAVSIFLALQHGAVFADGAGRGTLSAVPAVVVFCFVYAFLADKGWYVSLPTALVSFLLSAYVAVEWWSPSVTVGFLVSFIVLVGAIFTFPRGAISASRATPPAWDIPARMVAATTLVIVLTGVSALLGPSWTGALSPFPVFTAVLGTFIHRHDGAGPVRFFLWGVLVGLISFAAFFLVVGLLLPANPLVTTYSMAGACALSSNLLSWSLWFWFRARRTLPPPTESDAALAVGK